MEALRLLSIAAASKRVGYVFLVDGKLKDWRVSEKAAKGPSEAAELTQTWINQLRPDALATEKLGKASKRGEKTKELIAAIAGIAEHNYVLDVAVERSHDYANKYDEAAALAERYPELKAWLPKKRRFFDNEPRNIVLFEALSLADKVLRGPSTALAAAMG